MFATGTGNLARHAFRTFLTPLAKPNTCLPSSALSAAEHARACLRPSRLSTLSYHFLSAEAPRFFAALAVRAGDFGSTTHDHALLHSSESETPCFLILAHSFTKIPGVGWGRAKVHGKWSFRGKEGKMLPTGDKANPFRITSLYRYVRELPWNHIVAKNRGVGV
jgi:hypothetical protein